jgi:lipid-A-disaccharide synthase
MLVAGEASGDQLAAELVCALRAVCGPLAPTFFGAGGAQMAAAGVDLAFDLTRHAVIGLPTPAEFLQFRRLRDDLVALATARMPDAVVFVDFFAFNGSLAQRIRAASVIRRGPFQNWHPKLVQFVSPQVWASRAGRARRLERTHDLLLSILPFEPPWYARHAPRLRVEFVGHPLVDRHIGEADGGGRKVGKANRTADAELLLLPGSRTGELRRHLPVMLDAARRIASETGAVVRTVLPNEKLLAEARPLLVGMPQLRVQVGGLSDALRNATVALASTGTVTLECAWFGVPTVALYKTSWLTYQIGKRIVNVKFLAMPNLLADASVMPEFIQHEATPENLAREVIGLLRDESRRSAMRAELAAVVASLGAPGACERAARAIVGLIG